MILKMAQSPVADITFPRPKYPVISHEPGLQSKLLVLQTLKAFLTESIRWAWSTWQQVLIRPSVFGKDCRWTPNVQEIFLPIGVVWPNVAPQGWEDQVPGAVAIFFLILFTSSSIFMISSSPTPPKKGITKCCRMAKTCEMTPWLGEFYQIREPTILSHKSIDKTLW